MWGTTVLHDSSRHSPGIAGLPQVGWAPILVGSSHSTFDRPDTSDRHFPTGLNETIDSQGLSRFRTVTDRVFAVVVPNQRTHARIGEQLQQHGVFHPAVDDMCSVDTGGDGIQRTLDLG